MGAGREIVRWRARSLDALAAAIFADCRVRFLYMVNLARFVYYALGV